MHRLFLFGLIPVATLACEPNAKEALEDRIEDRGRISIPLTATSSSGVVYHLTLPSVLLSGPQGDEEFSIHGGESLDRSLAVGAYVMTIEDFALYRQGDDTWEAVTAEITSENPMHFNIHADDTTVATISFRVDDQILVFETGDLEIQIEVDDSPELACEGVHDGSSPECAADSCEVLAAEGLLDETDQRFVFTEYGVEEVLCEVAEEERYALVLSYGFVRNGGGDCLGLTYLDQELEAVSQALDDRGAQFDILMDIEEVDTRYQASTTALPLSSVEDLSSYTGVIYHNGGWSDSGSEDVLDLLSVATDRALPILFMGDDVAKHAQNMRNSYNRSDLFDLMGVEAFHSNGRTAQATALSKDHPMTNGDWGVVTQINYLADADVFTSSDDADVALVENDIVLAQILDRGYKTGLINASLHNSHGCPISDEDGLRQLSTLMHNALDWLNH